MIQKRIDISTNMSADSVFQIIEIYFSGRYKTERRGDSTLKIKKLYSFRSSFGWINSAKYLNFNDSGCFQIDNSRLLFSIDLIKPFLFWILLTIAGLLVMWKIYQVSLLISSILTFVPLIIGWINGLYELNRFVKFELDSISKRINS